MHKHRTFESNFGPILIKKQLIKGQPLWHNGQTYVSHARGPQFTANHKPILFEELIIMCKENAKRKKWTHRVGTVKNIVPLLLHE